jgi:hypothetical protein
MNVPRGTILGGVVRPLSVRNAVADAFRADLKTTHRVPVTHENSEVTPGHFRGLDLESGRAGRDPDSNAPRIRARCRFDSGAVRVVSVSPVVAIGDLFWMRAGTEPRARSLITLEVATVNVARLQDMNDAAALAEGVAMLPSKFREGVATPRDWFAKHWDAKYWKFRGATGRALWAANPWVWIYGLKIHRVNVDLMHGLGERPKEA